MEGNSFSKATKVYCQRCDEVFSNRSKYEQHLKVHSSLKSAEVCPIDTAIGKFTNYFKKKYSKDLE